MVIATCSIEPKGSLVPKRKERSTFCCTVLSLTKEEGTKFGLSHQRSSFLALGSLPTVCGLPLFHVHHYSSSHSCLHMVFGGSGFCSIVIVHVSSPTHRSAFHSQDRGLMHPSLASSSHKGNLNMQTRKRDTSKVAHGALSRYTLPRSPTPEDPPPYR